MYYPNPHLITKMIQFYIQNDKDDLLDDLWKTIRNRRLLKVEPNDYHVIINRFYEKENHENVVQVAKQMIFKNCLNDETLITRAILSFDKLEKEDNKFVSNLE